MGRDHGAGSFTFNASLHLRMRHRQPDVLKPQRQGLHLPFPVLGFHRSRNRQALLRAVSGLQFAPAPKPLLLSWKASLDLILGELLVHRVVRLNESRRVHSVANLVLYLPQPAGAVIDLQE